MVHAEQAATGVVLTERTAELDGTYPVPDRPGVTPRRSPHHGTVQGSIGRPRPAPPDVRTSLAHQRGAADLHLTHEADVG
jgi:hypothetical protein